MRNKLLGSSKDWPEGRFHACVRGHWHVSAHCFAQLPGRSAWPPPKPAWVQKPQPSCPHWMRSPHPNAPVHGTVVDAGGRHSSLGHRPGETCGSQHPGRCGRLSCLTNTLAPFDARSVSMEKCPCPCRAACSLGLGRWSSKTKPGRGKAGQHGRGTSTGTWAACCGGLVAVALRCLELGRHAGTLDCREPALGQACRGVHGLHVVVDGGI